VGNKVVKKREGRNNQRLEINMNRKDFLLPVRRITESQNGRGWKRPLWVI